MAGIGKIFVGAGLAFLVIGLLILFGSRFTNIPLGQLPGDASIRKGNFSLYAPLGTCLLLSLILTLLANIFLRFRK